MASLGLRFDILGRHNLDDVAGSAGAALDGLGEKLKGFGKAGAVGLAAGFGAALVGAISQESVSDKLAAQLGLNQEQNSKFGKIAGDLYANAYGESFEQVNEALGAVASSFGKNLPTKEIEGLTANALDLATAFDLDVSRAAQVAGQAVTTGLAKNGVQALDLLTVALQKVPAAVREDVLDASDEYGQFFASLGFNGDQAFGLLADAAAKGSFGIDKIGDAVKESTLLLTDVGNVGVQDAYKAIGLSAEETSAAILTGGPAAQSAYQKVVAGLQSIKDPSKQAAAAVALFGTPLEDLNKAEIPEFLSALSTAGKSLGDTSGAVTELGATLNDNAGTNIESFKRQLTQTFVELVGGSVLPAVSKFASFLARNVGPALILVGDVLQSVGRFIKENSTAFLIATGVIGGFAIVLGTMAAVTATVAAVTRGYAAAQLLLNLAVSANPFVIAAVALGALVGGLIVAYKQSETFRGFVDKLVGTFRENVLPIIQAVIEKLAAFAGKLIEVGAVVVTFVAGVVAKYLEFSTKVIGYIAPVIAKIVSFIATVVQAGAKVVEFVAQAVGKYLEFAGKVGGFIAQVIGKFGEFIAKVVAVGVSIGGFVVSAVGRFLSLKNKVFEFVGPILSKIGEIITKVASTATAIGSFVLSAGRNLASFLGAARRFVQPVIDLIQGIVNKAQAAIEIVTRLAGIGGVGTGVRDALLDAGAQQRFQGTTNFGSAGPVSTNGRLLAGVPVQPSGASQDAVVRELQKLRAETSKQGRQYAGALTGAVR